MPVRYFHLSPPPERKFVEPDSSDAFIYWLFHYRCVMNPAHFATEINEIEPRSRSKKNLHDWENRVPLCRECHNEYHKHGVNSAKIEEMKLKRVEFLKSQGRDEYINYVPVLDVWLKT